MVWTIFLCFLGYFLLAFLVTFLNFQSHLSEKRTLDKLLKEYPDLKVLYHGKVIISEKLKKVKLSNESSQKVMYLKPKDIKDKLFIILDKDDNVLRKGNKHSETYSLSDISDVFKLSILADTKSFEIITDKEYKKGDLIEVVETPLENQYRIIESEESKNDIVDIKSEDIIPPKFVRLLNDREKIEDQVSNGYFQNIYTCVLVGALMTIVTGILINIL